MGVPKPYDNVFKLTRPDYHTIPPVTVLQRDIHGDCWVEDFTILHNKHGMLYFTGKTNVANLDLDSIGGKYDTKINRYT